jgi:hypothetical protein
VRERERESQRKSEGERERELGLKGGVPRGEREGERKRDRESPGFQVCFDGRKFFLDGATPAAVTKDVTISLKDVTTSSRT